MIKTYGVDTDDVICLKFISAQLADLKILLELQIKNLEKQNELLDKILSKRKP